jgi:hypothetical protein
MFDQARVIASDAELLLLSKPLSLYIMNTRRRNGAVLNSAGSRPAISSVENTGDVAPSCPSAQGYAQLSQMIFGRLVSEDRRK